MSRLHAGRCPCFRCLFLLQMGKGSCSVEGCDRNEHASSMCRVHYLKDWRKRRGPRWRRYRRFSEETRERRRAESRRRYRSDPVGSRARTQAWRERNADRLRSSRSAYGRSKRGRFSSYRYDALRKGIEWKLSRDQFDVLVSCLCYYCGELSEGKPDVGVWRMDRSRGFDWENCAPCCYSCSHASESTRQKRLAHWRG